MGGVNGAVVGRNEVGDRNGNPLLVGIPGGDVRVVVDANALIVRRQGGNGAGIGFVGLVFAAVPLIKQSP
jgi:hypothetical protein